MVKKCETCKIKYKYCNCFLEYTNLKDDLCCNKNDQQKFDERLKGLSLWIYVQLGKIQWNIITWKTKFLQSFKYGRYYWCRLHAHKNSLQRFWKKNLGEHKYFCDQSNMLLLADAFENFRNMCLKIYELDSAKLLSACGLA